MFDAETTALLRAIHGDVCENVFHSETSTRTHVAFKVLESARSGERRIADLRKAGHDALGYAAMARRPGV